MAIKQVRFSAHPRARQGRDHILREAQTLARLAHPNIVGVHDVLDLDEGIAIAMDFVDGTSLRAWLTGHSRNWREVAAGQGLAAAHRAGVVEIARRPRP